jgi:hypothetical protein
LEAVFPQPVKATALNGYILSGLGSIDDKPVAKEACRKGLDSR